MFECHLCMFVCIHFTALDNLDLNEESPSGVHAQIKRVVQQVIDESHPGVQELMEAGYDPQDSVEAIEQSMGDVHEAMKLLDIREMEEGAEPGLFMRSTSREKSMPNQYVCENFCLWFICKYFPEMLLLALALKKMKILLSYALKTTAST